MTGAPSTVVFIPAQLRRSRNDRIPRHEARGQAHVAEKGTGADPGHPVRSPVLGRPAAADHDLPGSGPA